MEYVRSGEGKVWSKYGVHEDVWGSATYTVAWLMQCTEFGIPETQ
jgi:hypothetical protein